jgi:hypothetical protein
MHYIFHYFGQKIPGQCGTNMKIEIVAPKYNCKLISVIEDKNSFKI